MLIIKFILNKYTNSEIELFLAHILKKSKEFLYMNPDFILTSKHLSILTKYIKQRESGEPIAYILGYKDFMGFRFKVNKNVLIPRPETEGIIELVLNRIKNYELGIRNSKPITILDLGTGSGCIAISLAKVLSSIIHNSKFIIHGSDISKKALKVARANAKTLSPFPSSNAEKQNKNIKFIHSNLFENIRMNFDVIIANLPYGWNEWKNNSSVDSIGLRFEPKVALFTKENGLYLYKKLFEQIKKNDHKPQYVFLEFDPRQKQLLNNLVKQYFPVVNIKFHKDFNNLWRYAEIKI